MPVGESLETHAAVLMRLTGATEYLLMPANGVFALGVGHIRRKALEPGDKSDEPAVMMTTTTVDLDAEEWDVLLALKEELTLDEICENPWDKPRGNRRRLARPLLRSRRNPQREKSHRPLLHLPRTRQTLRHRRARHPLQRPLPLGRARKAARSKPAAKSAATICMTHCYWREGGPQFGNVNIMGVVHGTEKDRVLEHKAAIDRHLAVRRHPRFLHQRLLGRPLARSSPRKSRPKVYHEWHAAHA